MKRISLVLLVTCWTGCLATAQDSVYGTATASSGVQVRINAHFNLNRDCSPGAAPEVRVITPPKNGTLSIRIGNARAPQFRECRNVDAPARIVFYQSNPGYSGEDKVAYELKKADGMTEIQNITISVTPLSATPGRNEKVDNIDR